MTNQTTFHHCDSCKINVAAIDYCPRCSRPLSEKRMPRRQRQLKPITVSPFEEFEVSGELAMIKKHRWRTNMGYSED